jgi:predicted branched-subunit amino acid permease
MQNSTSRELFVWGFKAMMPFWLGAIPFGIAYAIAAQKAGLNPLDIQWMSLTVFSAGAQIGIVQLLSAGASPLTLLLTALTISLHHLLYGLSLAKRLDLTQRQKAAAAYFLTDGAYGIAVADGKPLSFPFLFGAELSMFFVWNVFTAISVLVGQAVSVPTWAHLGFIAPLTFFILLISTVKTKLDCGIVVISAAVTSLCLLMQLGSATIFVAGIGSALVGTLIGIKQE